MDHDSLIHGMQDIPSVETIFREEHTGGNFIRQLPLEV